MQTALRFSHHLESGQSKSGNPGSGELFSGAAGPACSTCSACRVLGGCWLLVPQGLDLIL
jgi:hypothetical protein